MSDVMFDILILLNRPEEITAVTFNGLVSNESYLQHIAAAEFLYSDERIPRSITQTNT